MNHDQWFRDFVYQGLPPEIRAKSDDVVRWIEDGTDPNGTVEEFFALVRRKLSDRDVSCCQTPDGDVRLCDAHTSESKR